MKTTIGDTVNHHHWQKFFNSRLDKWIDMPKYRRDQIPVYDYLGMTKDEFMDWRAFGELPERAVMIWSVAQKMALDDVL
ncbi:MAG: hypothetical protein ABR585_12535 [Gemmatimonadaceae bacterium]|nr:hypothetical protein [Actinomycetota bacterium]